MVALSIVPPCHSQAEIQAQAESGDGIIGTITGLWEEKDIQFLGHTCRLEIRPTISRFQLNYKGKIWCPGWTNIEGRSQTKSKKGAYEHAARDFAQKALNAGLITQAEANPWIG